jgi:hypothetical protein
VFIVSLLDVLKLVGMVPEMFLQKVGQMMGCEEVLYGPGVPFLEGVIDVIIRETNLVLLAFKAVSIWEDPSILLLPPLIIPELLSV